MPPTDPSAASDPADPSRRASEPSLPARPTDRPRASWEDLTPLGRAVVVGGAFARGATWLAGWTAGRAARIAADSSRAFREGRDGSGPPDPSL